jgi:hypothetical protein
MCIAAVTSHILEATALKVRIATIAGYDADVVDRIQMDGYAAAEDHMARLARDEVWGLSHDDFPNKEAAGCEHCLGKHNHCESCGWEADFPEDFDTSW